MALGLVGIVQYVGRLRELIARKERVLVAVNEAIPFVGQTLLWAALFPERQPHTDVAHW